MKVTESGKNALHFSKTRPNDLYYVKSWIIKTAAEVVRNIRAMLFQPLSLQG